MAKCSDTFSEIPLTNKTEAEGSDSKTSFWGRCWALMHWVKHWLTWRGAMWC
jgi:hypothetical protein